MINKNQITAFAKDILHSKHQLRSPQIMHPVREWFIGIFIGAALLAGCIFLSVQTYFEYRDVDLTVDTSAANTATVYRESLIEASLDHFEQKESLHNDLIKKSGSFSLIEDEESNPSVDVASSTADVPEPEVELEGVDSVEEASPLATSTGNIPTITTSESVLE